MRSQGCEPFFSACIEEITLRFRDLSVTTHKNCPSETKTRKMGALTQFPIVEWPNLKNAPASQ